MFDPTEPGRRIQERRKQQGLAQEQLGQAVCISVQAVSKWENGESLPNYRDIPCFVQSAGRVGRCAAGNRALTWCLPSFILSFQVTRTLKISNNMCCKPVSTDVFFGPR